MTHLQLGLLKIIPVLTVESPVEKGEGVHRVDGFEHVVAGDRLFLRMTRVENKKICFYNRENIYFSFSQGFCAINKNRYIKGGKIELC